MRMEISVPYGGDGGTVWLSERWRDEAAIEQHRRQPGHEDQHKRIDELIAAKRVMKGGIIAG
jgi:quinol monooxygenase YgiN